MRKRKNISKDQSKTDKKQQLLNAYNKYQESMTAYQASGGGEKPSIRKIALKFGVSFSALQRRVSGAVKPDASAGRPPHFTKEEEEQLKRWVFEMSDHGFAVSRIRTVQMAQRIMDAKCRKEKRPRVHLTHQWWEGFKKRHPDITRRRTDELQRARGDALTYRRIQHFFNAYNDVVTGKNITSDRIYNCDEVGVIIDAPPRETFAKKGKKRVYVRTTGNRTLISMMGCASASGVSVPPALVYPGKRLNANYLKNAPIGTKAMCTPNGYFTAKAFRSYLDHFAAHSRPTAASPVLLILDGFSGHIDVDSLEHAKNLNIHVICFPSHSTHALQPLDVGIFSPFKNYYRRSYSEWMEKNPNERLLKEDFAGLMRDAYYHAFTPFNITSAFKATGLYPFCPEKVYERCKDWKQGRELIVSEMRESVVTERERVDCDNSDDENDQDNEAADDYESEEENVPDEAVLFEQDPVDYDDDFLVTEVSTNESDSALELLIEAASQSDNSQTTVDLSQLLAVPSSSNDEKKKSKKRKASVIATEHLLTEDAVMTKLKEEKEAKRKREEEKSNKKKEREQKRNNRERERQQKGIVKKLIDEGRLKICRCRKSCDKGKKNCCKDGCSDYCMCPCTKSKNNPRSESNSQSVAVLNDVTNRPRV